MKFRKKPVVIEAIQYVPKKAGLAFFELHEFVGSSLVPYVLDPAKDTLAIHTLEGTMTVQPGDWIIKGVKGEFYPCKPDIFEATYEAVTE
jgi:hypothetical protein